MTAEARPQAAATASMRLDGMAWAKRRMRADRRSAPALNSAPNAPPPMPQTSTSSQSIMVFAMTELVPK
ncbi:hypothetical protein D3C87_1839970 [compost metagenome]